MIPRCQRLRNKSEQSVYIPGKSSGNRTQPPASVAHPKQSRSAVLSMLCYILGVIIPLLVLSFRYYNTTFIAESTGNLSAMVVNREVNTAEPQSNLAVLDKAPDKEWLAERIIRTKQVGRCKYYFVAWKPSYIGLDCFRRRPGPNTESWRASVLERKLVHGLEYALVDWEPTAVRSWAFQSPGGRRLLREYYRQERIKRRGTR